MQLSYRGSVNRWECDENDHLNVRFYVEKHWQTLVGGLPGSRQLARTSATNPLAQVEMQHIRFLRESRIADGLSGYCGVVAIGAGTVDVMTELRKSRTDEPVSTCIHRLRDLDVGTEVEPLPDHAAPRGLSDVDLPHGSLTIEEARDHGFRTIGRGAIGDWECAGNGLLQMHHYMGRLSDSMPHLWAMLGAGAGAGAGEGADDGAAEAEGGAVLEYRLAYHRPLAAGSVFELVSGIRRVGPKVQQFAHLMFDAEERRLMVSAEAVGVRMDLNARKALTLSAERQELMRQQMVRAGGSQPGDDG